MHILILYGSLTGNTLLVCEHIQAQLIPLRHSVDLIDQSSCDFSQLSIYDFVLIGASTWGEGEPNPSTQIFIEQLESRSVLADVRMAIFGLGDSAYEHYCGVVDRLEATFALMNIHPVTSSLRLDGFPDEVMFEKVDTWVRSKILPELHTVAERPPSGRYAHYPRCEAKCAQ